MMKSEIQKRQKTVGYSPSNQRGAVLIVGLIMVLLITIIGLAAVRGSNMQEMMAGNMRDMNASFQNAEAGLRVGETNVDAAAAVAAFNGEGKWLDLQLPSAAWPPVQEWDKTNWNAAGRSIEVDLAGLDTKPRYVLEELVLPVGDVAKSEGSSLGLSASAPPEPKFYRVTSRGTGSTDAAETIVQSTYKILP